MSKLYIARRRGLRRIPFYASPESMVTLNNIRDRYRKILGREVSTTIIVRRALALLWDHLQARRGAADLTISGDQAEAAAVLRCVR